MLQEQFVNLITGRSGPDSSPLLFDMPIVGDRRAWMAAVIREAENPDLASYHLYVAESDSVSGAFISHLLRVNQAAERAGIVIPGVLSDTHAEVRLKDEVYNVVVHIGSVLFEAQGSI